jgi:hypothetical protein
MAAVTFTAIGVQAVFPDKAEIYPALAGSGSALVGYAYHFGTADGRLVATASGTAPQSFFHGIATKAGGPGQGVDLVKEGHVGGFDLTNVVYGGTVYAGTEAGTYDDTAVGGTVPVGICVPLTDAARTKVLYVSASWEG